MIPRRFTLRALALIALLISLPGCIAALAAGAGAAGAIAYSERGVSSKMAGSVDQTIARSQAVFSEMRISTTGQDGSPGSNERELKGRVGDLEITVDVKRENERLVAVEVFAQRSTVDWDRDYARRVLEAIIARS